MRYNLFGWPFVFYFGSQERLLTYCDAWETCIVPLRVVGLLVLSNTAGFSFLNRLCIVCDVPTGESDLVTVYCGRS